MGICTRPLLRSAVRSAAQAFGDMPQRRLYPVPGRPQPCCPPMFRPRYAAAPMDRSSRGGDSPFDRCDMLIERETGLRPGIQRRRSRGTAFTASMNASAASTWAEVTSPACNVCQGSSVKAACAVIARQWPRNIADTVCPDVGQKTPFGTQPVTQIARIPMIDLQHCSLASPKHTIVLAATQPSRSLRHRQAGLRCKAASQLQRGVAWPRPSAASCRMDVHSEHLSNRRPCQCPPG